MKVLHCLLLVIAFNQGHSQTKTVVGNVTRGFLLISELSVIQGDSLNNYTWKYTDSESGILKSIVLTASKKEMIDLFNFILKKISETNGATDELEISGNKITATAQKIMGLKNVRIVFNESHQIGLNKNEIDKLFKGLFADF